MASDPLRQGEFGQAPGCEIEDQRDDFFLRCHDFLAIKPDEDRHDHEGDALVPVPVWVVAGKSESVGRRERGKVGCAAMGPLVSWPREGGLKDALVPQAGQPTVGAQQVEVDGIHHQPLHPDRFTARAAGHGLLGQLAESVPIASYHTGRDRQRSLGHRVIGCDQDALLRFDCKDAVSGSEMQPVSHILGQGSPNGATDLTERQLTSHVLW